jgi:hypothetical protein
MRLAISLFLLLSLFGLAIGAETKVRVLTEATRDPGTFTIPEMVVPDAAYEIRLEVDRGHLKDIASGYVLYTLELSADNGETWITNFFTARVDAGPVYNPDRTLYLGPSMWTRAAEPARNRLLRGSLTVAVRSITVGAVVAYVHP